MNENERSDLERLIAVARPPGPSGNLDDRVRDALSAPSLRQPERGRQGPDRRLWFSVAASALIAAGIGFLGGRMTAGDDQAGLAQKGQSSVVPAPSAAPEQGKESDLAAPNADAPWVTTVPLDDERLAALFLPPRSREGLLGSGPVRVETSQLP